jgi:signal transduction histidine kinase
LLCAVLRLSTSTIQHRFQRKLRAPAAPEDVRRTERWLATARVFLAISTLVAIYLDPTSIRGSIWSFELFAFYLLHSVLVMVLLRRYKHSSASFRGLVHAGDILWPTLFSLFAGGQSNPFFLFFVFVLAAAAYRWGLWETLGTAIVSVILLWMDSLAIDVGVFRWFEAFLSRHHWPALPIAVEEFEPKRLFMKSVYLLVMGLLLGYLAEQQKQLRSEKIVIARILGCARVEIGLAGTLRDILSDLLNTYGAREIVMASQETGSQHVFLGRLQREGDQTSTFEWLEAEGADREKFLFSSDADVCFVNRDGDHEFKIAVDRHGTQLKDVSTEFLDAFATKYPFRRLLMITFLFGGEWWGRIFLLDPELAAGTEEELHFLQEMVRQVGPAVYNVYLLRRLRLRAGAAERAKFARELHDGAVQSLIAVEMQVDVLRRQAVNRPELVTDELSRIQGLLRDEVLKLRELMQQLKSMDVDSRRLLGFLRDTVERFQRETGILAEFHSTVGELDMPQPVCREVARIVQEALVNVRKHSGAGQVLVQMAENNETWSISVEDDGMGFPFSGKLSDEELESARKGPVIIKERVRLLEGQLAIESIPGHGSRLQISVPRKRDKVYG